MSNIANQIIFTKTWRYKINQVTSISFIGKIKKCWQYISLFKIWTGFTTKKLVFNSDITRSLLFHLRLDQENYFRNRNYKSTCATLIWLFFSFSYQENYNSGAARFHSNFVESMLRHKQENPSKDIAIRVKWKSHNTRVYICYLPYTL